MTSVACVSLLMSRRGLMLDAPRIMDKLIGAGLMPEPGAPVRTPGEPSAWRGDVALPNDRVMQTLIAWAQRHPDAAQQLEPRTLEWTAAHRGC